MANVLLVSKPVSPPWNDSSKNLVRDLASHMRRHNPIVLCARGANPRLPGVQTQAVYSKKAGQFAPKPWDNAGVMLHLLARSRADLWHFFFAPNPLSSLMASVACRMRRRRSVQTVCSAPRPNADLRRLAFADRTVTLSKHTEQRLWNAGIPSRSIRRIPPAIAPLSPLTDARQRDTRERHGLPADKLLMVYPGDLEVGTGAQWAVLALADLPKDVKAHLVIASRAKTERAREHRELLETRIRELGVAHAVTWVGQTADIHDLLGSADLVTLPSEDLYAKMDLPLALLEAMAMARPVLLARGTPAEELAEGGAAVAVEPRRDAISAATRELLTSPRKRIALGASARQAVQKRYHPQAMASAYEMLYDELLGNCPSPRT